MNRNTWGWRGLVIGCLGAVCGGCATTSGTAGKTGYRESTTAELASGAPVIEEPATVDVLTVTRDPRGVPLIEVTGTQPSTTKILPPALLLQKFSTWPGNGEVRCVNHEGVAIVALAAETDIVKPDEPPPTEANVADPPEWALKRLDAGITAVNASLARLLGVEAAAGSCALSPDTITRWDSGRRKLRRIELCDEACLTAFLSCAGSTTNAAAAMQALFVAWRQENPAVVLPKADSRMTAWLDLEPTGWQKDAPWWLAFGGGVVPSAYGKRILIGVGVADGSGSNPRRDAQARGLAEIGKVLAVAVSKQATAAGRTIVTESELGLRTVMPLAFFEHQGKTWVMSMCDERCYLNVAKTHGIKLSIDAIAAAAPGGSGAP